jgi:hypothetical protein
VAVLACSASPGPDAHLGSTSSAIIDGIPSTGAQDFVVEVVHPVSGGAFVCSGSLVAPNLILTARHCVTATPDLGFSCDTSGNGTDGGALGADYEPSSVFVYVGLDAPGELTSPAGQATRFFHDDATNVCNHDLALLEVSPPITGVPIATLDLDSTLSAGQALTAVGWGVTGDGGPPGERQQLGSIPILAVGPATQASGYDLGPSEFDVGQSICQGDSGGPALDAANAIVGVVSRGGNGADAASPNPATTCVGAGTVNIYTETAAFRDVILNAFAAVGSVPTLVEVAMGESCTSSGECTSGLCAVVDDDAGMTCTQDCKSEACPSGFRCDTASGAALCAPSPESSGCASGSRARSPAGDGSVMLVFVVLLGRLRARYRVYSQRSAMDRLG